MSDTTFDLTSTNTTPTGGYTRATRKNLSAESIVKVKESCVKRILTQPLSANVQVHSFDPTDMKDSGNFFHFVGSWRTDSSVLGQHLEAYYMHNVFHLVRITSTTTQDANGNDVVIKAPTVGESLFDIWHNVTIDQVAESCDIYFKHSEDVDRQNLR